MFAKAQHGVRKAVIKLMHVLWNPWYIPLDGLQMAVGERGMSGYPGGPSF